MGTIYLKLQCRCPPICSPFITWPLRHLISHAAAKKRRTCWLGKNIKIAIYLVLPVLLFLFTNISLYSVHVITCSYTRAILFYMAISLCAVSKIPIFYKNTKNQCLKLSENWIHPLTISFTFNSPRGHVYSQLWHITLSGYYLSIQCNQLLFI